VDAWIAQALQSAAAAEIRGKAVTPYLLDYLVKASRGQTLETNIALLVNNARVAAQIAKAYSALHSA
jgi:pseudouridine-5'-phosphate glycosidase